MKKLIFEQLHKAVNEIPRKLESIERLLLDKN